MEKYYKSVGYKPALMLYLVDYGGSVLLYYKYFIPPCSYSSPQPWKSLIMFLVLYC